MNPKQIPIQYHLRLGSPRFETLLRADPQAALHLVAHRMQVTPEQVRQWLIGMFTSSPHRNRNTDRQLSTAECARISSLVELISQVDAIDTDSGDPVGFNSATWFAGWLEEPLSALGGRRPSEFMASPDGQDLISQLLAIAQSGAYG